VFAEPSSLGRPIRAGGVRALGRPSAVLLKEAIERNDTVTAQALLRYLPMEDKFLYDVNRDDAWAWMTYVADRWGEDAIFDLCWDLFSRAPARQSRERLRALPVELQVAWCAEMMRGHQSGRRSASEVQVVKEDGRYVISFDPCGSGGRMRIGDPVSNTPPRTEAPFHYGVTKEPHDWSWKQAGVCYYCAHCAIFNELTGIAEHGTPNWVTEYPKDAADPCRFIFYKRPDLIPPRYYSQVGRTQPAATVSSTGRPIATRHTENGELTYVEAFGRALRADTPQTMGEATLERVGRRLREGNIPGALELLDYYQQYEATYQLGGGWRDLDVAAWVAARAGEAAVGEFLRATVASWMRAYIDRLAALTPLERLYFLTEMKRAERSGPRRDGRLTVLEEHDRFVVEANPCGDCGRLRRQTDNLPDTVWTTREPHPWAWGQIGVPSRCARACVAFELLPAEWTGAPLWITDWNPDPDAPCRFFVYKRVDAIPVTYFERLGLRKP